MPTIAHRPSRLVGQTPQKLTMWLVAAILVAVVATTFALSLIGSGDQQADPSAGATQAAPAAPKVPVPSTSPPLGGARP
jgi:hypothetical protein